MSDETLPNSVLDDIIWNIENRLRYELPHWYPFGQMMIRVIEIVKNVVIMVYYYTTDGDLFTEAQVMQLRGILATLNMICMRMSRQIATMIRLERQRTD